MSDQEHVDIACEIMADFTKRTGLTGDGSVPRRYLWTDAFAVCNYLALHRAKTGSAPLETALTLVDQVHETLGRHRADDVRTGWISGLSEAEGSAHPTCRGLRIGKPLGERRADEPLNERLEWDRDGQYFHYLTKWMHALARVANVGRTPHCLRLAIELARAAHAGFTYTRPGSGKRMVWKMSIDLTRPLVASMGHHDPLDGLLTFAGLQYQARRIGRPTDAASLDGPIDDMRSMCAGGDWATTDTLGLGGLLCDMLRVDRLVRADGAVDERMLDSLLDASAAGLEMLERTGALHGIAAHRLAFRELGLAIGLRALQRLAAESRNASDTIGARLDDLLRFVPLAGAIEEFWLEPSNQQQPSWQEHLDINAVMLATSLMPDGFLDA